MQRPAPYDSTLPEGRGLSRWLISFMAVLLGIFTFASTALAAPPPADAPVALVGEDYGWAEAKAVLKNVLETHLSEVTSESIEGRLAPEDFARYRVVVFGGAMTQPYTSEESQRIENYVRDGGKIVLIQQAPKNFRIEDAQERDKDSAYLFGRSYYRRDGLPCTVYEPKAPLLEGAFEESQDPFWLQGAVMLRGLEWQNMIGHDDFVLVGQMAMGHGQVYYFGHELFRLLMRGKQDGKEQDVNDWVRMLTNALKP